MASTGGPKVKIGKINATSVNFATEMVIHNDSKYALSLASAALHTESSACSDDIDHMNKLWLTE